MLEIGSLIDGKYKILNKVGQGGMSVVYLAMNEKANKQWAIKEVRKDGIKDFEVVKQGLIVETDMLKKLSHPNLPSIVDVIENDDTFLIVMDYIQGNPLNKTLEEYGAQPQEYVIEWAKQLCDVLGYLHSRKPPIIYRDMKPANIMLKPDGNVTLIDFGTAREYKEKNIADTTCLGTVGYAAPEQFGGMGQTDARTDIYCLGATLYHLVTGMNPCEPPYEIKPIRQINPSLSNGLEKIILKCTQRDPNDRYQSCAELMYALEHYNEIDDKYRKRAWRRVITFSVSVLLMFAFLGTSIWSDYASVEQRSSDYDYRLSKASSVDDYYNTILIDPTRKEAYIEFIEFLSSDGIISKEDKEALNILRGGINDKNNIDGKVDVLNQLKNASVDDYEEVCYLIGIELLYSNESNIQTDRLSDASVWFKEAEHNDIAKVFYTTADCLLKIERYKNSTVPQAGKARESYKTLWDKLGALEKLLNGQGLFQAGDKSVYEDDVKILVIDILNYIVDEHIEDFLSLQENGNFIDKKEVVKFLEEKLKSDVEDLKNSSADDKEKLINKIEKTIDRVNSYKD